MNENGKSELIMKCLTISRNESYESNPGKYKGTIEYEGHGSKHTLTLDESLSERVLAFIGPVICEAAALVAEETRRNITRSIEALQNQKAIEAVDLLNAGVPVEAGEIEHHEPPPPPPFRVPHEPGDVF